LSVMTCKKGVTENETALFADLEDAKVRFSENLRFYMAAAPGLEIYDGCDGKLLHWFEIGKTSGDFWVRCDIQAKSIN